MRTTDTYDTFLSRPVALSHILMLIMQQNWESQGILEISKETGTLLADDNGREFRQGTDRFRNNLTPQRPISAPPPSEDIRNNVFQIGLGNNSKIKPKGFIQEDTWGKNSLFSSDSVGSIADSKPVSKAFSSSIEYNSDGLSSIGALRSNALGVAINRPKSAAPQFSDIRIPFRSPPGLESSQPNDKVGSTFRDYAPSNNHHSSPGDLLTDAPNGVSSSSSLAETAKYEKLKQRSVMDLIQEDFPKTPSPEYESDTIADLRGSTSLSEKLLISERLVSSFSNQNRNEEINSNNTRGNHFALNNEEQRKSDIPSYDDNGLPSGMSCRPPKVSEPSYSQNNFSQNFTQMDDQQRQTHPVMSRTSDTLHNLPTDNHPHQQLSQNMHDLTAYNSQQIHYNYHGGESGPVPAPVMQPGHNVTPNVPPTMYVNPLPYGNYATVQYHHAPAAPYHPHHVSNHLIHPNASTIGARVPHGHEYVSVMPMQAGITPHMGGLPANGAYIYYHQPPSSSSGVHPTVTVLDSNGRPSEAVAVHTIPAVSIGSSPGRVTATLGQGKNPLNRPNSPNSKNSRRYGRQVGKKGNGGSLDSSKHSLSSFCNNILEEFRTSKNCSWTAYDVKGNIVELCQDQYGSRFIQQRLESNNEDEKSMILNEVLPSVRRLRNDVFGNYVVQKLLENGSQQMKDELKKTLQGEILSLSTQMYGCRVVQKALESLYDEDLTSILAEFHGQVLTCIHDQNGNHVIQKCIEVMSAKAKIANSNGDHKKCEDFMNEIDFILKCVWEAIAPLSCHPYGCRVLQRILEHCHESQKIPTLDHIKRCHRVLLDDQYGNYVIQHVLQFGRNSDRDSILEIVVESGILALSRQKFASNVVEKLLKYGTSSHRNAVVREMLKVSAGKSAVEDKKGSPIVLFMVKDQYANYVVQTCLDVVPEGKEKRQLLQELNNNSSQLKNYTFAKHIITKLGDASSD